MSVSNLRRTLPFRLLLLLLMGIVILYLGVSFVRQAGASHQRREELRRMDGDVATARQQNARLEEHLEYIESPEAAEEWARENSWAKQDEVSVSVVAPSARPSSGESRKLEEEARPMSHHEAWWDLVFGER